MQHSYKHLAATLLMLTLAVSMPPSARAHLMPSQHGTLNIVDGGAFMVLSLPISAFVGIDDNDDGEVSMPEFNNHRGAIVESVKQNVTLRDSQGNASLHGIMLSPVAPHNAKAGLISQLTIMGRFSLNAAAGALQFQIGLYGSRISEQSLEITATRRADSRKSVFELTPADSTSVIFPERGQPEHKLMARFF